MKMIIICLSLLMCSSFVYAKDSNQKYFSVVDKNTDQVYKTKRIKIDETNGTVSFDFICKNGDRCGKLIKGNIKSYFVKD